MMLKAGLQVAQDYTVFNYRPPRPQKDLNTQDRTIVTGPGIKPAPKFVFLWHSKEKTDKEVPQDPLIIDNLETSLETKVDKACGNTSGSVVERFIKSRASEMFGHPVHLLEGPGPSIPVSGPHEEFSNSAFGI